MKNKTFQFTRAIVLLFAAIICAEANATTQSTDVAPISNTNMIINAPSSTSNSTQPTSALYSNFIPCPTIPICPDINELYSINDAQFKTPITTTVTYVTQVLNNVYIQFSSSQTFSPPITAAQINMLQVYYSGIDGQNGINYTTTPNDRPFCPDQCTVTRSVSPAAPAQPTTFTNAVCPSGYAEIGSYNMQPEIAYSVTGGTPEPMPIDQATYNSYQAANPPQTCSASTIPASAPPSYCATAYSGHGYGSAVDLTSYSGPVIGQDYFASPSNSGTGYSTGGSLGNGIVRNTLISNSSCLNNFTPYDCSHGSLGACNLWCNNGNGGFSQGGGTSTNMGMWCENSTATTFQSTFTFTAYYTQCLTNPGYYYTTNVQAASLVCARSKAVWKSQ